MFVDRVTIDVRAGDGGNGSMSFRRERFVPRGGPDGGDGGRGGSVVVIARQGVDSLSSLAHRKLWIAGRGGHGSGRKRHGRNGKDLTILVPPGTLVMDAEQGFTLRDLVQDEDQMTAARGGTGGRGNVHYKSPTNRAPRERTPGEKGEQRRLTFELKVIADVGLIGKPNAGKSTLLSRMSSARPDIADYPFTTRHPNLGRVQISFDQSFVVADIPGLIEGVHTGVGLGHEFLRHIERAGVLVHLVEPAPMDGTDPVDNYRAIHNEMLQYDHDLGTRPEIVVVTKAELPGSADVQQRMSTELNRDVLLISAVTGQGLNDLTGSVLRALGTRSDEQ